MFKLIKKLNEDNRKRLGSALCGALVAVSSVLYVGCSDKVDFTRRATTQFFIQDFNPPYLDVLWMVEDRSPLFGARTHLVAEATKFFKRLENITDSYRMGIVTTDIELRPGLKPFEFPVIIEKNVGTLEQRVGVFSALVSQVLNLKTSGLNQGFESVLRTLNGQFVTRPGVPLVLVFISDSDDSKGVAGKKDISHYVSAYLAKKGNNPDLLRVYSVNYLPVPEPDRDETNRCATRFNADIDLPGFEDRYFELAEALGGETADLCDSFGDLIDLTGLRLHELPKSFPLEGKPDPSTLQVLVFLGGQELQGFTYVYDALNNAIVFDVTPPEGTTIQVTYLPQG